MHSSKLQINQESNIIKGHAIMQTLKTEKCTTLSKHPS